MYSKFKNFFLQRGSAQLPIILGLLLIGVALPAALRLVQQQQETRQLATETPCLDAGGECISVMECIEKGSEYTYELGYSDCSGGCCLPNDTVTSTPTLIPTNTPAPAPLVTPTNTPAVSLGACGDSCMTDADCGRGLFCYEQTFIDPIDPGDGECTHNAHCSWCGNSCVLYSPGMVCPQVMPPSNMDCVCQNGSCQAVSGGGVVMGERTVRVCRNPECPEKYDCICSLPGPTNTPRPTKTPMPTDFEPIPIPTKTPVPEPEGCKLCPDGTSIQSRADYNCDGVVNELDFDSWYKDWTLGSKLLYGDFNCDGVVDVQDFAQWYDEFNLK